MKKYNFTATDGNKYDYPANLTNNRGGIEGKVIGCLTSDLSLFMNCSSLKPNSFITEEGIIFFQVLKKVYDKGASQVDFAILDTVLSDAQMLREQFIKLNGFQAMMSLKKDINPINFDTYLSEYSASSSALDTFRITVEIQCKLGSMSETMTNDELESFVDYKMNEIRKNNVSDTGVQELTVDDEYIKSLEEKLQQGTPYGLRLISNTTMGLHYGNFSLYTSIINAGKSTIMFNMIAMDLADLGESVLIYCNESEYQDLQELLLTRTLVTKLKYTGLTRNRLKQGDFEPEHKVMIAKAQAYIREHYKEKLYFKKANKYSVSEFLSIMRRYTYKGVRHFFLDTYKAENSASENVRGELIGSSVRIYETCRTLGVNCFATYQTAPRHLEMQRRGLDLSVLSEAKAVGNVLDVMLAGRQIYTSEYTGCKHDIKPYKWVKNDTGYVQEFLTLDPAKKYLVINVAKNRWGAAAVSVVYENQLHFGLIKEIGLANIVSD